MTVPAPLSLRLHSPLPIKAAPDIVADLISWQQRVGQWDSGGASRQTCAAVIFLLCIFALLLPGEKPAMVGRAAVGVDPRTKVGG